MTDTIWMAIAIIVPIILIVVLISVYTTNLSRKQKQKLLGALNNALGVHQLQADKTEYFRNRVLSLDVARATLIYIKINEDNSQNTDIIDLRNMHKCELIKAGNKRVTTGKNGKSSTEEHINEILLSFTTSGKDASVVVFYSEIDDGLATMLEQRKKAEEWRSISEDFIIIHK